MLTLVPKTGDWPRMLHRRHCNLPQRVSTVKMGEYEHSEISAGGLTANLDGRFEFEQIGLAHEDVPRGETKLSHFMLSELHLFAWTCVAASQQARNDVVQ